MKRLLILLNVFNHEEGTMATSSIFANFDINDMKKARAFVRALEKSAREQPDPVKHEKTLVTDMEQVRALLKSPSHRR